MGSSVGVTKAHTVEELRDAITHALTYDEWVVVEEAVVGREIEVAVLGGLDPQASGAGEIIPGAEFYDYEDKYVTDGAQLLIPAPLTADADRRGPGAGGAGVPRAARRRPRPRRLLLRGGRARLPVQRGQHDARVHPDLDVPEAVAGGRGRLPGADRPARRRSPSSATAGAAATRSTRGPGAGSRRQGGAQEGPQLGAQAAQTGGRRPSSRPRAAPRARWRCP